MNPLIKLAERIEDKDLRKKVIDLLKDIKLTNPTFKKYSGEDLEKAGSYFSVGKSSLGPVERDVLHHTVVLTQMVIIMTDVFEQGYGLKMDKDSLIAASLLHDIMKTFEFKRDKDGDLEPTGIMLDHLMLAVAELYARGFPEDVIHIVASHFGEEGPTPPRSFEAVTFHQLDTLTSMVEYYIRGQQKIAKQISKLVEKEKERGDDSEHKAD